MGEQPHNSASGEPVVPIPDPSNVTRILEAASAGDKDASAKLLPLVYDELRRMAAGLMSREKAGLTLQPTALVHEAYLRLLGNQATSWQNRAHFFGAAALAMRRILIDRARHVKATRPAQIASFDEQGTTGVLDDGSGMIGGGAGGAGGRASDSAVAPTDADDLIYLDEAMRELHARDDRQHDVVMLRYFAGLTIEQTAEALGVSISTVKNEWMYARAWLMHQIDKRRVADGLPPRSSGGKKG
ncbi:MAG: sigma-70 family RNA polymerase sigma factor [Phycisphaerales bacterium]|nr:sigma-70 family RNA polymerase sigma factor [Phycisphaerales bacterium]